MPFREELEALAITATLDFETANERMAETGLSDGLPLVPPAPERVAAMLSGWRAQADALLDFQLMPSFVRPSLWDIGANAVMAGCRREQLPVIVAALWAMCDEAYNLLGVQATTGSAAPVIVVHGPIAARVGVHGGENCFGPGHRANACIGRAVSLVLRNVGGAIPGVGDMATLGQPGKYTWCFAENDAASPFPPFHAGRGFQAGADAVTVFAASGSSEVVLTGSSAEDYAACLGHAVRGHRREGQVMVVLPPEAARLYFAAGWDAERWRRAIFDYQPEGEGVASPESLLLVVAGGVGIKAALIPGWGTSRAVTRPVQDL
jgi:hypothetical protein